jgi:hypothetical protein
MKKIKCFDYTLYRARCNKNLYKDSNLVSAIDTLLTNIVIDEQEGKAESTVGQDFNILHLQETHPLVDWIISQIMTVDKFKFKNSNTFNFTRHWANRMHKDSSGLCHTHMDTNTDYVAIFYLEVPPNSSDLVVVNNGKEGSNYLDYDEKDRHHINVESGTLIIHKSDVPHAVSIHNSKYPRTCLVFEFKMPQY